MCRIGRTRDGRERRQTRRQEAGAGSRVAAARSERDGLDDDGAVSVVASVIMNGSQWREGKLTWRKIETTESCCSAELARHTNGTYTRMAAANGCIQTPGQTGRRYELAHHSYATTRATVRNAEVGMCRRDQLKHGHRDCERQAGNFFFSIG